MIKKKDFVEIDFTGIIKESDQIFDTTEKENAKKIGLKDIKPLKICVGEGMLLRGFDEALEGKELNKQYQIELKPEQAFGPRKPNLIKLIPMSVFLERNIHPYQGLMLNMDGMVARISSVSGGRVITDFNSPLAGKTIIYEFKINRVLDKLEEKAKTISDFFTGEEAEVKLEGKKVIFTFNKKINNKLFERKVKDILDLELEIKEKTKTEKK